MTRMVVIDKRFRGPPDSGNGGYSCGLVAEGLPLPVEVRLKRPPPLDRELTVEPGDGTSRLLDGDAEIAVARTAVLELDVPDPPGFEQAHAVLGRCKAFDSHPFPTCFVCGPDRRSDGLRIFPGPLGNQVASTWEPNAELADKTGRVQSPFIWAALDCPGSFALTPTPGKWMVLGSLAVDINGEVTPGERCVVTGWEIAREGRKHFAGTALFNEAGDCVARAKAVWIEIDPY